MEPIEAGRSLWVPIDLLHGEDCEGCLGMAKSAAVDAAVTGSVGATHQETEVIKVEDVGKGLEPKIAHSARVHRLDLFPIPADRRNDTVYALRLAHRGQYAERLRGIRNQLRSVREMIEGLHGIPDDTKGLTVAELGGIDTEVEFGERFLEVAAALDDLEAAWRELPRRA